MKYTSQNNELTEEDFLDAERWLDRKFPKRRVETVLLITPPDADIRLFSYSVAKRGRYPNYPPYGLMMLASHLRLEGVDVRILNLNSVILEVCLSSNIINDFDYDRVCQKALEDEIFVCQPDLIGLTCMFTQTHRSLVDVCRKIRKIVGTVKV